LISEGPSALDKGEKYSSKEAWERMNRALRGARIGGPRPLKNKPKNFEKEQTEEALLMC